MRHDPPECTREAPPSSCPPSAKCPNLLLFSFYTSLFLSLLPLFFFFLSFPISHFISILLSSTLHLFFWFVFSLFPPCSALFLSFSSFLFPFLLLLLLLISPLFVSHHFSSIQSDLSALSSTRFISFFFHFPLFALFFYFLFSLPHLPSSFFFYSIFLIPPCLALSLLSLFLFPSVCLFCSCPFPPFFVFTPPLLFFSHLLVPCT